MQNQFISKKLKYSSLKKFINNTLNTNVYSDNLCKYKYACTYTLESQLLLLNIENHKTYVIIRDKCHNCINVNRTLYKQDMLIALIEAEYLINIENLNSFYNV